MYKYFIIFLISFLFFGCSSTKNKNEHTEFTPDKLCHEWLFINSFDGIVTKIHNLKKDVKKYKYYTPSLTYRKDGTFTNYQGDYQDNGTYVFDSETGLITEYFNMGSTKVESYMKLTYLDNEYMLILVLDEKDKKPSRTFFYKKK